MTDINQIVESLKSIDFSVHDGKSDEEIREIFEQRVKEQWAKDPEGMAAYEKMLEEIDLEELGKDIGSELRDGVCDMF
jgi:polyhydroxyalkanoate synthesis regulator protein